MEILFAIIMLVVLVGGPIFIIEEEKRNKRAKARKKALVEYNPPNFVATQKVISGDKETGIMIDESNKKVCLINCSLDNQKKLVINDKVLSYRDILSSEIDEDIRGGSTTIITKTSRDSQLGGTLLGGLILGPAGAVIGGLSGEKKSELKKSDDIVTRVGLRIIVNDINNPIHIVNFLVANFLDNPVRKNSTTYKSAIEQAKYWHSLISVLIKRADTEDRRTNSSISSITTELEKLAKLRDTKVLTEEEFLNQKHKLLGN